VISEDRILAKLHARGRSRVAVALSAVLVVVPGVLLAGCGGSSPANATTTQHARVGTTSGGGPAKAKRGKSHRHGAARGASTRRSKGATGTTTGAKGATGGSHHGTSAGAKTDIAGARAQNPCTLVSKTQAQSIVGAALRSAKEAPLGPTCIFTFAGRRASITLAVESLNYAKTVGPMKRVTKLTIGGRPAECGTLGTQMLFVSLSGGKKVMNVTASCRIAEAFASDAVPRVHT
jgi:hypothetical protein